MLKKISLYFLLLSHSLTSVAAPDVVIEDKSWYLPLIMDQPTQELLTLPINLKSNDQFIDIRGVGDTAHVWGGKESLIPIEKGFSDILKTNDPSGLLFKSDLMFVNWESVVSKRCYKRRAVQYYFLSHPNAIKDAINHGFNLFGFANNHARDCDDALTVNNKRVAGQYATASHIDDFMKNHENVIGAGVKYGVYSKNILIDGVLRKVTLSSVFLGWAIPNVFSFSGYEANLIDEVKKTFNLIPQDSDINILAIHTQDKSGSNRKEDYAFKALKKIATLFIKDYRGSVVYGHGPHTFAGVKVIKKDDGKKGVIFTSLGNFLHQGVIKEAENYIGRALFDQDLNLREVQVLPFVNSKNNATSTSIATFYNFKNFVDRITTRESSLNQPLIQANFKWQRSTLSLDATENNKKFVYKANF